MSIAVDDLRTPPRRFSLLGSVLSERRLSDWSARLGIGVARQHGRPFRLGKRVIVARHQHVREMLDRDLDFLIAPINEERIEEVNGGPFVLGMDRNAALVHERRALYSGLTELDLDALEESIRKEAQACLARANGQLDAITDFARPVAVATAVRVFGIGAVDNALFKEAVRAIFAHTFLNLGSDQTVRKRALLGGELMQRWFAEEIARRRASGEHGTDYMGQLLRQGLLDDDGVRRTLGGMLVGSIDTTTTTFAHIFCVVDADPSLKRQMLDRLAKGAGIYGLCLDALRRWPHNPILLREARLDTTLGGTSVKAGDSIVAWTQAAMQDPAAFPQPRRHLPDRAMTSYLHFGGGLHPCAGRAINRLQLPILIEQMLASGASLNGKLRYAGPFPDMMPITLKEVRP